MPGIDSTLSVYFHSVSSFFFASATSVVASPTAIADVIKETSLVRRVWQTHKSNSCWNNNSDKRKTSRIAKRRSRQKAEQANIYHAYLLLLLHIHVSYCILYGWPIALMPDCSVFAILTQRCSPCRFFLLHFLNSSLRIGLAYDIDGVSSLPTSTQKIFSIIFFSNRKKNYITLPEFWEKIQYTGKKKLCNEKSCRLSEAASNLCISFLLPEFSSHWMHARENNNIQRRWLGASWIVPWIISWRWMTSTAYFNSIKHCRYANSTYAS